MIRAAAFEEQARSNEALGSPFTARVLRLLPGLLDPATSLGARLRDWPGEIGPSGASVPLRLLGGLHALVLGGDALALAYPPHEPHETALRDALARALADREAHLLAWLDGPPQTNEAGRSWAFVAGMLWLASRGLPPRFGCLEIGASAGVNLMLNRYAYDLGGVRVGPDEPVLRLQPEWRGPPPPDERIAIASLAGCDIAPLDLRNSAEALRLKAYIWPEHRERFARLEPAVTAARAEPPDLVRSGAADFVEDRLTQPQEAGTTRVLQHSVMWQYVPEDEQARVTERMERSGAEATAERPLAWLSLEANRTVHQHELKVRYWPGGEEEVLLGTAHPHGEWVEWFGA